MSARMNWAKDRRRQAAAKVVHERVLESADPSSYEYADPEPDPRPLCLVCDKPVTPGGDEARQLRSSGSWLHKSCLGANAYSVTVEVRFSRTTQLRAASPEDAERLIRGWVERRVADASGTEILEFDVLVTEEEDTL